MSILAVGSERVSRIVGYALTKGTFQENSPNLPQRIAILGEANNANQGSLSLDAKEITSAQEAGELYGFGSPIHQIARILKPVNSDGVGGIPLIVYPQAEASGATATVSTLTVTAAGNATKNVTHKLIISGRTNVDGESYDVNIVKDDTPIMITAKITDVINNVLGAPVIGVDAAPDVTLTTKWKGLTSAEVTITVDTQDDAAGVSYGVVKVDGAGSPTVTSSLEKFGNEWNTIVINPYGAVTFDELETFNGIPGSTPTGRYAAITFKPFISLFGSVLQDKDDIVAITDATARKTQVTHVLCPAPNSAGCTWEAAANAGALFARVMQDTPHLDISGLSYPDMPIPSDKNIGDLADYDNRDFVVKRGGSTVYLVNDKYQVQDFITTYHPDGEVPPQFRYCRNLMIDFNIRYGYYLLELINVVNHSIAESDQPIRVSNVIKPKQWKAVLDSYGNNLAQRNLIVDLLFMQNSINVSTNGSNPDRLDTFFRYKRSPFVRIASTVGEAGFAFGVQ